MASGVEFYLDLVTGSFDSKLNKSKNELKSFSEQAGKIGEHLDFKALLAPIAEVTAAITTIGGIMAGIHGAVELGDNMVNLSNRTGIAVENLMMMRRLFKDSGMEAERIGPALGKMQKYLEAAATTGEGAPLLKNMGLDSKAEAVKKPDLAFKDIGSAIAQIESPTQRAASAIAIFGKQGAELLQVFMNPDFKSMGDISATASAMGESAYLFKEAHDQLEHIGGKLSGLFIGMAAPVMAAMEPLLEIGDHLDLSGAGAKMGAFLENFATDFNKQFEEVFEDLGDYLGQLVGHLPEVIIGSFAILQGLVQKLGSALLYAFHTPLDYLQAAIQTAIEKVMQAMGNIPGIGKLTGTTGFRASSYDENLKQVQAEGNGATQLARQSSKDADATMAAGGAMIVSAYKESLSSFKGAFTPTEASAKQLSEEREKSRAKYKVNLTGGDELEGIGKGQNAFADSLRKIGGGGFAGGQGSDPILAENRTQSAHQAKMVNLLEGLNKKLAMSPDYGFGGGFVFA
jgi:hypothetical protein